MGNFDYPYGYEYEFEFPSEMAGSGVIGVFAAIYLLVVLFSFAVTVATYILHSFGLYTLAQRRGIRNGWLAWVPLGNLWILGSISDQFQYLTKGRVKNRRKTMLILGIGVFALCLLWFIALIASLILQDGLFVITGTFGGGLILTVIAITLTVLQYMSYYDLFCSCQPSNGALYLILSILFSITLPIFVFICRKKDGGMPPKRQPQVQVVTPQEPVCEPEIILEPEEKEIVDAEPAGEPEEGFAQPEEFEE